MNTIDQYIHQHFGGELDAAGQAELTAWLQADPAHAERFVRTAAFYNSLHVCLLDAADRIGGSAFQMQERRRRRLRITGAALAAAALIALAVTTWFALQTESHTPAPAPAAAPIATLVSSEDAVGEFGPLIAGQDLAPQTIRTTRGETSFLLSSLASVTLVGEGELRLDDPMHVTMVRGKATFHCPPEAHGFTVALPDGSQVVDLGTEFCVYAEPGAPTEVWVYEGSAAVATAHTGRRLLREGDGAAVDDGRFVSPGLADTAAVSDCVKFTENRLKPFHGGVQQDGQHLFPTIAQVFEDGRTLRLKGNAWKTIAYPYTVTEHTVIEAEFRVTHPGEIHAMGFDVSRGGAYGPLQLFGDETVKSIARDHVMDDAAGWVRVVLPVGRHYTGRFERLLFVCDDDVSGAAECWFRNVRVYESPRQTTLKETQE